MALHPKFAPYVFNFNIQELTKSNKRLLRSFLIWYYSQELPGWITQEIESQLDKFLDPRRVNFEGQVFKECLAIRVTFILLGKEGLEDLLNSVYSTSNIERWYQTGRSLAESYQIVRFPNIRVKCQVWKRGYRESSPNKHKSKSQEVEVMLSKEAQELIETKERIKLKQAKLFEERLDRFLEITSEETDPRRRKELFSNLVTNELDIDTEDLNTPTERKEE